MYTNFQFRGTSWNAEEIIRQHNEPPYYYIDHTPHYQFQQMFGVTKWTSDRLTTSAFIGDLNDIFSDVHAVTVITSTPFQYPNDFYYVDIRDDQPGTLYQNSNWGIAVIRPMPVPEPSIIALFAAGLFGIRLVRRRQNKPGSDQNGTYFRLRHCLCEELATWQSLRQWGFGKAKDRRAVARDDIFSLSKCHSGQIIIYSNNRIFCDPDFLAAAIINHPPIFRALLFPRGVFYSQ